MSDERKPPSASSDYRRTIYLPPDHQALLTEVAALLEQGGYKGLFNADGTARLSTTIQAALKYAKDHPPQTRGD